MTLWTERRGGSGGGGGGQGGWVKQYPHFFFEKCGDIKMATMPIFGKRHLRIFFSKAKKL